MSEIPKHVTVYDYIEAKYKEEWFTQACGWKSNRWKQYEESYQYNLMEYGTMYPLESIYNSMVEERDELRELYYEIHDTPPEEQISLWDDRETLQQILAEAQAYQISMVSDGAALEAFNKVAPLVGVDDETRIFDVTQSMQFSTQTKNDAEIERLEAAAKEKAESTATPEYLVRGAPLRCLYGSHARYLDMKETHGVYLNDKPLVNSLDAKTDENIFSFGICSCPTATLKERTSLMRGAEVDKSGKYLRTPDDSVVTGLACKPRIVGLWKNTNKEVNIARHAAKGVLNPLALANYSAVTNTSYILCKEGGYIYPLSSGQLEYTSYFAEFYNYPFEDIYSDAFYKWCDIKNVCPYYPGAGEYTDWYKNQIEKTMDRKERKQLYEDYLAGAYQIGLDNMSEEERKKVKAVQEEYLSSDLLKEKEKDKLEAKYAGLRVDYGYNHRKDIASASPGEEEFYQYYIEEAKFYDQEISDLRVKANLAPLTQSIIGIKRAKEQVSQAQANKANAYERYSKEMELYEGPIGEQEKAWGQEVTDAFHQENYGK